ncbi:DUF1223 domain-containing protein [Tautonia rosea]|uniref:DUF1223 domain-containing protein n=1 Tax=Tautonia rosea TaxID=2728037 RepID=UPI0014746E6D|nr:DUF1223 domain-containing protein [Tautonia rosea]
MEDRLAISTLFWLIPLSFVLADEELPQPTPSEPSSVREVQSSGSQIVIELYTSQGCNYCPNAERLIQEMIQKGYGRNRVIPLAFHVDYFNTPWADPFSSRFNSGRQWAYHEAFKKRDANTPDLYFTPMIMVDGRYPMSGYHSNGTAPLWPLLKSRLDRASKARREASLAVRLESFADRPSHRSITIRAQAKTARLAGKELLACVAITEGPMSTSVPSGENAGETLIEHNVVRSLQYETVSLRRDALSEITIPVTLAEGGDPARSEIVIFLQDEATGAMFQAMTTPWNDPPQLPR